MGKGSNTTTSTSSPPAAVLQQYKNVQNQANSVASNPYYFYPGSLVAGMSPDQTSAIGATGNIASAMENPANTYGMAQPFINSASNLTGTAANTIGGTANDLAALQNPANTYGQALPFINQAGGLISQGTAPVSSADINNYMNPYLQQVGQTTSAEMNQNNAIQQQQLLGNAAASGALGGDRVGLAQSALANQQNLAENATLANINSQGYNSALGAAQTTKGQQLQGGFLSGQTGQLAENAALSGLTAPVDTANTIAGTQLAAGSQMGNLGTANEQASLSGLNAGLTGATSQFGMGTAQQQQQQNQLNAAYGQWLGSVQYPFQNTNFLTGVSSGLGSLEGGTSTTTPPKPSTASSVLGDIGSIAGIAAMFMNQGGRVGKAAGGPVGNPDVNAIMAAIHSMPKISGAGAPSEVGNASPTTAGNASTLPAPPPPLKAKKSSSGMLKQGGVAGFAAGGAPYVPHVASIAGLPGPMNPASQGGPNAEIVGITPIAHSADIPPPPQVQGQNGQKSTQSSIAGLGKSIGTIKQGYQNGSGIFGLFGGSGVDSGLTSSALMSGTAGVYARGGPVAGFASGGDVVPTPMSEQILDYQMMGQLTPGAQVQKTRYEAPKGVYAAGGTVGPTAPETAQDVSAQLRALTDPRSARRAVFVATGTPVPRDLPDGVDAAHRPEGTLFSADKRLLQQFQDTPAVSQDQMAQILGYPHSKEDARPDDAHVVRAHDGHGVAYETLANPEALIHALRLAAQHAPGAHVDVTTPVQAVADRARRHGYAAGGAPAAPAAQGMQGVSSMPLVGTQAGLSAPGAAQMLPGANAAGFFGPPAQAHALSIPGVGGGITGAGASGVPGMSIAAPQTHGLAIPTGNAGASFAPVTMPGGASTGTITDPSGVPSGFMQAIDQSSPYFNSWSSATAPSSGLHPNTPAPAPAPTQSSINQMIQTALQKQQAEQTKKLASQENGYGYGHKRGGRIGKAGGGTLDPVIAASGDPTGLGYLTPGITSKPLAPPPGVAGTPGLQPTNLQAGLAAVKPAAAPSAAPSNLQAGLGAQPQPPAPGGVDPDAWYGDFASKVTQSESGGNPAATNAHSTAAGADQFTNGTWLSQMHRDYPAFMSHNPDSTALSLRSNPAMSKIVTEDYAKQNGSFLASKGIPVSYTNLDLAHRFGPTGAMWVLTAPADTPAAKVLSPDAIKANPSLGKMTTGQIIAQSGANMGAQVAADRVAQNGASDVGPGFSRAPGPQSTQGTLATPFYVPSQVTNAANAAARPASQIPVPKQTMVEKMANSPWLALADGFATMAAGTSPYFSTNFGQGVKAGIEYLKGEQGQQRARQELQANVAGRNVQNQLSQRAQAMQGGQNIDAANQTAVAGYAAIPGLQGAQITANSVPGVSAPPMPEGMGRPTPPTEVPGPATGAASPGQSAPSGTYDGEQAVGLPAAAPAQTPTIVGPTGQQEPYRNAYQQAQALLLSRQTAGAAQQWLNTYGPQVYSKEVTGLGEQANAASVQKQQLDELRTAANQFLTGPGANTRAELLKAAQTASNATGIPLPDDLSKATTAAQIIPKVATFIQSGLSRMASDRGGAVVMQEVMAATPNMGNTRQGLNKLVGLYGTLADRQVAMSKYVTNAVQGGEMTYPQATNAFNEQYPPGMWASRVDPVPVPASTTAMRPGYVYRAGNRAAMWTGHGWANP